MTVLEEILAAKRRRLAAGEIPGETSGRASSDGARFLGALRGVGARVIAEIKHRSPSAGEIVPGADRRVEELARAYRRAGAAALSVVVEQDFFGGDPSWLARAKSASGLPVLMKDFVLDERQLDQARAHGADAVLLIVAALSDGELLLLHRAARERGLAVLVEAHDGDEARRAVAAGAELVGVNARDLATFRVDLDAMGRLGRDLPVHVIRVAESGIRGRADLLRLGEAGYGAFLVGESLLRAADPARALRALRGEGTTEVKICGVTRPEDLEPLAAEGVDWVGLNFSPLSPRRIDPRRGRALREAASFAKGIVAVFAGNAPEEIHRIAESVGPDVLQIGAGDPAPEGARVWRTVRVGTDAPELPHARWEALLFDTAVPGQAGGTGVAFDWERLASFAPPRPFVLAGGLTSGNVAGAVKTLRPDVVDVASGVESSPGVKDPAAVRDFVAAVRGVPEESANG